MYLNILFLPNYLAHKSYQQKWVKVGQSGK